MQETKERTLSVCGGSVDVAFDLVNTGTTAAAIQECIKPVGIKMDTT